MRAACQLGGRVGTMGGHLKTVLQVWTQLFPLGDAGGRPPNAVKEVHARHLKAEKIC